MHPLNMSLRSAALGVALLAGTSTCLAQSAAAGESNQRQPQPQRIENTYPLTSDADRVKTVKLMQQLVVDLLATFNNYKEVHWNLNGPLYLVLHEYYQGQADYYRGKADIFAERSLQLGYSIDGRYATIARTTRIPELPAGYVTDNDSIKLQLDRVAVLDKEVYDDIAATGKSDPVTQNQLQDLAYAIDKNLWQLRIHLQKPGSTGEDLPWAGMQTQHEAK